MKDTLKMVLSITAVAVVVGGVYWFKFVKNNDNTNNNNQTEQLSYVSISINPEIELAVNDQSVVKEVININDDAAVVTSDLNLVGKNVDDAIDTVIDTTVDTGYLDEYADDNQVIVTTMNDNETTRKTLEDRVINRVNKRLERREAAAVVVAYGLTDALKQQADKYDVSNGKMLLIDKAIVLNSTLKVEDLVDKSIKEIQQLIKDARKNNVNNNVKLKAAKEKLKTTYQNKVKTYRDTLLKNNNIDITNMTEEQKNTAAKELIKNKKTEIKEKVKEYKEKVKDALENQGFSSNIKEQIQNARQKKNG